jgi:hypothetical protein
MHMTKKGILLTAGGIAIFIIAAFVTFYVFKNGDDLTNSKNAPSSSSPTETAPDTDESKNAAAQQAVDAGQAAISNGNKAEAQKQLESAEKLYTAAGNADGVETVKGLYPVVEHMPVRTTPADGAREN